MTRACVIGAGPAGLACAASLSRAGVEHVVVERGQHVGGSWRNHYDRLHLHTAKQYSGLPFSPWPKSAPRYPSRAAVVDYLEAYATEHGIKPRFGVTVERVSGDGAGGWRVRTSAGELGAQHVIMASGCYRVPFAPDFTGLKDAGVDVVHASQYKNPAPYAGKRTLVVGCGNSGAEIALDLAEHGVDVAMVIRGPVHVVPRELFGVPLQATGIPLSALPVAWQDALASPILALAVGDLRAFGIERPKTGVQRMFRDEGRVPMIDIGTVQAIKDKKIAVTKGVARFEHQRAIFADGSARDVDAVILATGYTSGLEELFGEPVDVKAPPAGVHFIGFRFRGTGVLREIAIDAQAIAMAVAKS